MWAMKILKYIGKVIFRILLVPVILLVASLSIFVKILVHVSAFAVGLFLLFLLGCIIWTFAHQLWSQTGLLLGISACSVGVFFGVGMLESLLDNVSSALAGLMVW